MDMYHSYVVLRVTELGCCEPADMGIARPTDYSMLRVNAV
jgi:hypothetical protein